MHRPAIAAVFFVLALAAACDPAPAPGDVGIERIETTQGIQNLLGQVPLIANKATYMRVFLRGNTDDGGTVPAVGAMVTIDGVVLLAPFAPVGVDRIVPPSNGSDPRSLADSFLFVLPAGQLTGGSHHFHVELLLPDGYTPSADANVAADFNLRFGPDNLDPITHHVYGARYGYRNVPPALQTRVGLTSAQWPEPTWGDFEVQRVGAEAILPVANLVIDDRLPTDAVTEVDCAYSTTTTNCEGYAEARIWAQGLIDAAFPGGGQTIVVLQPEHGNGHYGFWYVSPVGNNVINVQGDTVDIGSTLAHEIGHSFGLAHTFEDPLYPRANGALGPYIAVEMHPVLTLISGEDAAGTPTAGDFMSYGFGTWISPYNYCKALVRTSGGQMMCPAGLDGWDAR